MQDIKYIYKILAYSLTLSLAIVLFSCRENDDHIEMQIKQSEINISIRIPSLLEIGRNSRTNAFSESAINELTLLAYQDDETGIKELKLNKQLQSTDYIVSNDMVNIKLQIPKGRYDRLVFIANANDQAQTLKENSDYAALNALDYENSSASWNVNEMQNIPMSAVIYSSLSNGLDVTNSRTFDNISFIRMLARIDIINSFSSKFKLQTVYIYNANENGTIIADQETYAATPKKVKLPSDLHKSQKPISFDFSTLAVANNAKQEMLGQIYLFEAEKANNSTISTISNSPRTIIYGEYPIGSNNYYYYPIDFTYASSTGAIQKGDFMPVIRNHKYILDIVRISGPGFKSAEKAMQLQTSYTNIEVKTHQLDVNFTDVYYDGYNFLASNITGRSVVMGARVYQDKNDILPIEVLTDLPTFTVEAYDKNKKATADWFTVTEENNESGPTYTGNGYKRFYITSNSLSTINTKFSGYIVFKGKELVSDTIYVDKLWCGQNGVPFVQDIGGTPRRGKYMTHQFGDECWMIEDIRGGTIDSRYPTSTDLYAVAKGYATTYNIYERNNTEANYPRPNDFSGDSIYYYSFGQARKICPDADQSQGWVLPSKSDVNKLMSSVSSNNTWTTLGLKYWGQNSGKYLSLTGTFAAYIYENRVWRSWGKQGWWWQIGAVGQTKYFGTAANVNGLTEGTNVSEYWFPVRCIFK